MSTVSKKAILKALIDGVITELMVKTTSEQVYITEDTTLTAKLAEIVAAINLRAKTTDVETMIDELRQELLGDTPVEAYNTFTELAAYISEHEDVAESLTAAIGDKADKSVVDDILVTISTLGSLATKNVVSESDLDSDLQAKVNAASDGNHRHNNQEVLDDITSDKVTNWDSAVANKHTHSNKTVLDGITADDVATWSSGGTNSHAHNNKTVLDSITADKTAKWDSAAASSHTHSNQTVIDGITVDDVTAWDSKSTVHVSSTQPDNLAAGDLWFHVM